MIINQQTQPAVARIKKRVGLFSLTRSFIVLNLALFDFANHNRAAVLDLAYKGGAHDGPVKAT